MNGGVGFLQSKSIEADRIKLRSIETAIVSYVMVNGRLPCPADGSLASSVATAGEEVRDANGDCNHLTNATISNQITGVVPWKTIGITESDASNSYNARITYRVGFGLARNNSMDMTACDPAGTSAATFPTTTSAICSSTLGCNAICNTACSSTSLSSCTPPAAFLAQYKGLNIRNGLTSDAATQTLMDRTTNPTQGAAFVLISHGRNGAGAYNVGSGVQTPVGGGLKEQQNANGVGMGNADTSSWYAIDAEYSEGPGDTTFDDLVLHPSIMKIILQSQRGPRNH